MNTIPEFVFDKIDSLRTDLQELTTEHRLSANYDGQFFSDDYAQGFDDALSAMESFLEGVIL